MKRAISLILLVFLSFGCSSFTKDTGDRRGLLQLGLLKSKKGSVRHSPKTKYRMSWSKFARIQKHTKTWKWPLQNVDVSSLFGHRKRRFHEGIDLRARVGTPIYATADGTVYYTGSAISGYGKMTIIRHKYNLYTIYAHNKKNLLKKGSKVKKGQLIAYSGKTGRVTGPHLHFEVRHGTQPLNPLKLLPKNS